jgi:hypothetical protein
MKWRTIFTLILLFEIVACHRSGKLSATPNTSGVGISGWVTNVEGTPLNSQSTTVVLRDQQSGAALGSLGRTTTLLANGTFEFSNVQPGAYSISIAGAGGIYSPIVPVVVADLNIRNIELVVPRPKEITGQITMEGNGPFPELRFQLIPVEGLRSNPAVAALSPTGYVTNNAFPAAVPISPTLNVNPLADGTFTALVPDGDWNVKRISALPSGYSIQTMSFGNTDILTDPMRVKFSENDTIHLIVKTTDVRPGEVLGRLTGISEAMIATGPISVTLRGPMTSFGPVGRPMATNVQADGTFVFQGVLPGDYSALVSGLGVLDLAGARLSVPDGDGVNVDIEVMQHEVSGQIVVEGGGPLPAVNLSFRSVPIGDLAVVGYIATPNVTIRPLKDGSFRVLLPLGDRQINSNIALPRGYSMKSITYGSADVMNSPMRISKSDTAQLRITLTYSPSAGQ